MQTIMRTGIAVEDSGGMGFHEFCDALLEVARRKAGIKPGASSHPAARASAEVDEAERLTLATTLERLVNALPGATQAAAQQADRNAAVQASLAKNGGGTNRRESKEAQEQIS